MNLKLTLDLKENISQLTRDSLISGELGKLWVEFCEEKGINEETRNDFLDYINEWIDKNIKDGRLPHHRDNGTDRTGKEDQ